MMQKINFMISSLRLWIFQPEAVRKTQQLQTCRMMKQLLSLGIFSIQLWKKTKRDVLLFRWLCLASIYPINACMKTNVASGLGAEVRLISQIVPKTSRVSFHFLSCWHLEKRTFAAVWPWALAETARLNSFCIPRDIHARLLVLFLFVFFLFFFFFLLVQRGAR